jgi:hypothetical protein
VLRYLRVAVPVAAEDLARVPQLVSTRSSGFGR